MSYYKVTMVRGHQGTRQNKSLITFYYQANSLLEAMDRAKRQPGVKHTKLPVACGECSFEEYQAMSAISAYERAGCKK